MDTTAPGRWHASEANCRLELAAHPTRPWEFKGTKIKYNLKWYFFCSTDHISHAPLPHGVSGFGRRRYRPYLSSQKALWGKAGSQRHEDFGFYSRECGKPLGSSEL